MSSGKHKPANRNLYWACPYWKWDARMEVNCEGGRISFPSAASANEYMRSYCASLTGWKHCTVAKKLTDYYEGEKT